MRRTADRIEMVGNKAVIRILKVIVVPPGLAAAQSRCQDFSVLLALVSAAQNFLQQTVDARVSK